MPTPSTTVSRALAKTNQRRSIPWGGPESDGPRGGVTQSLISKYLVEPERFRIKVIEGLQPVDSFRRAIEFGQMWHECEEAHAGSGEESELHSGWEFHLKRYAAGLCEKYPTDQQEIEKWYNVILKQFPIYVNHWKKHPDVDPKRRTPLLQEESFNVPYELPSGRVVYLRGKWDSVDLVLQNRKRRVWLQENKTTYDIDVETVERRLSFDLQTMLYVIALKQYMSDSFWRRSNKAWRDKPIAGVRYNVIRRPLSGGKHSIKRKEGTQGSKCNLKACSVTPQRGCRKCGGTGRYNAQPPETYEAYYNRLAALIEEEPEHYFMRWNVEISEQDIETFKHQCLHPVLENLCDDYEWWKYAYENELSAFSYADRNLFNRSQPTLREFRTRRHFRMPYGLYSPVQQGIVGVYDDYLTTGSTLDLEPVTDLFPELT